MFRVNTVVITAVFALCIAVHVDAATSTKSISKEISSSLSLSVYNSLSRSSTSSSSPSVSPTMSASATMTMTRRSFSGSSSRTASRSASPTDTISSVFTESPSSSREDTVSFSGSSSRTASRSASPTDTISSVFTESPSSSREDTVSFSGSKSPSPSSTDTISSVFSESVSSSEEDTLSFSGSPSASIEASTSPSGSESPSASDTLSPSRSKSPSISDTLSFSNSKSPSISDTLSFSNSKSPSISDTESQTLSPTLSNSPSVSASPSETTVTHQPAQTKSITPSYTKPSTLSSTTTRSPSQTSSPSSTSTPSETDTETETGSDSLSSTFSRSSTLTVVSHPGAETKSITAVHSLSASRSATDDVRSSTRSVSVSSSTSSSQLAPSVSTTPTAFRTGTRSWSIPSSNTASQSASVTPSSSASQTPTSSRTPTPSRSNGTKGRLSASRPSSSLSVSLSSANSVSLSLGNHTATPRRSLSITSSVSYQSSVTQITRSNSVSFASISERYSGTLQIFGLNGDLCSVDVQLAGSCCLQSLQENPPLNSSASYYCSPTCNDTNPLISIEGESSLNVVSLCFQPNCSAISPTCSPLTFTSLNATTLKLLTWQPLVALMHLASNSSSSNITNPTGGVAVFSPGVFHILFDSGMQRSIPVEVDPAASPWTVLCTPTIIRSVRGCSLDVFPATAGCRVTGGDVLQVELGGDTQAIVALPITSLILHVSFAGTDAHVVSTTCVGLSWMSTENILHPVLQCLLGSGDGVGGTLQLWVKGTLTASMTSAVSYSTVSVPCRTDSSGVPCAGHGSCDSNSGLCACFANSTVGFWAGVACDVCSTMYSNSSGCITPCPVNSQGLVCNSRGTCFEGVCTCFAGASGASCAAQCPGSPTACSGHGACDPLSAECQCVMSSVTGYYGSADCSACAYGWSGDNCTLACPVDAATSLVCGGRGVCIDGRCVCDRPFCGSTCASSVCPPCLSPITFGWNCGMLCPGVLNTTTACSGHGLCDGGFNGTGLCVCDTGYGASDCSRTCFSPGGALCSGHGVCNRGSECSCSEGFVDSLCSSACPIDDTAGTVCAGHGTCVAVALHTATCSCAQFFGGPFCNVTCPINLGLSCSGHGACASNGTCSCFSSSNTGYWGGDNCSSCASQWFGAQCSITCGRGSNGLICNGRGQCTNGNCVCNNNAILGRWSGSTCTMCSPGYWGSQCLQECPGSSCNPCSGNGACSDGVNGTGLCNCYDSSEGGHFTGSQCDSCRPGFYGSGCQSRCPYSITPQGVSLVCGGNGVCADGMSGSGVCTCSSGYAVDVTGACTACSVGYYGTTCSSMCPSYGSVVCFGHGACFDGVSGNGTCACRDGYFGSSCSMYCPTAVTVSVNGTKSLVTCGGHGQCIVNNTCSCTGNYAFDATKLCTVCASGYTGVACELRCPLCVKGVCNAQGRCTCQQGFWGALCEKGCPGGANNPCSGHGTCDADTGVCNCFSSPSQGYFDGPLCNACQAAFNSYGCATPCPSNAAGVVCSGRGTCFNGKCTGCIPLSNESSIVAVCGVSCNVTNNACFTAQNSSNTTECSHGFWGAMCDLRCPGFDDTANVTSVCSGRGICTPDSGRCLCYRGYFGDQCQRECPLVVVGDVSLPCAGRGTCSSGICACFYGYYGADCAQECPGGASNPCSLHGTCDSLSGQCTCDGTSFGIACERSCPGGFNNTCSLSGTCTTTGACECYSTNRQGFYTGEECQECSLGWSGAYCSDPCTVGQGVSINRQCVCSVGFIGVSCSIMCPMSASGAVCGGHGTCVLLASTNTAGCSCDPNYYGSTCDTYCIASQCTGMLRAQCNAANGTCECLDSDLGHFSGAACNDCRVGYWGAECNVQCPCNNHGTCERFTSACTCYYDARNGYWRGTRCSYCAAGYIGDTCVQRNVELNVAQASDVAVVSASGTIALGPSITFVDIEMNVAISGASLLVVYQLSPKLTAIGSMSLMSGYEFSGGSIVNKTVMLVVVHSTSSFDTVAVSVPRIQSPLTVSTVTSLINSAISMRISISSSVVALSSLVTGDRLWHPESITFLAAVAETSPMCIATCSQGASSVEVSCGGGTSTTPVYLGVIGVQFLMWAGDLLVAGGSEEITNTWVVSIVNVSSGSLASVTFTGASSRVLGTSDGTSKASACALWWAQLGLLCGVERVSPSGEASTAVVMINLTSSSVSSKTFTISNTQFVTAIAVDGDSGIVAVNAPYAPSNLERFLLPTMVHITEYTAPIVGAEVFTATVLSVHTTTRLAWVAMASLNTVAMYAMNLFGLAGVAPDVLDSSGGTLVTVTGYGFVVAEPMECVFGGNATSSGIATSATVLSATALLCTTPRSEESADECTGTTINVRFMNRTSNSTLVKPRRPVTAEPLKAIGDGNTGYGSASVSSTVTVSGNGFTASSFAACRLYSRSSNATYFTAAVTVLNTTHAYFVQPVSVMTDPTASLHYSHDGSVFSTTGAPFVLTGGYHTISITTPNAELHVVAASASLLPLFTVHSVDLNGNRLLRTDDTSRSIYCGTLLPSEILAGTAEKVTWKSASDTQRVMTQGAVEFVMTLLLPQRLDGQCTPVRLVVISPTASWRVGVLAALQLSPAPVVVTADIAKNVVSDDRVTPQYAHVSYLNMIPDPLTGKPVVSNQSDVAFADASGSFRFLPPVVRTHFGGTLTLQFTASSLIPVAITIPVLSCTPGSEYSDLGSFHCLPCPDFGICDGSSVVHVEPSYWRSTQESYIFYPCSPANSCPGGHDCSIGYEGTLCSRCSEGYGRSQTGCFTCNARWMNIVGVVGVVLAQAVQVYLMAVRGAPFTAVEDIRLFPEATMRVSPVSMMIKFLTSHFQILGIVPFADMALPAWLSVFFESSRAVSSFNFNFSFVSCEFGEGAFRKLYVSVLYVPVLIAIFVAGAMIFALKNHSKFVKRALMRFGHGEVQEVLAAARSCVKRGNGIIDMKETIMYAQFLHPDQSNEHLTDYYNELLAWDGSDRIQSSAPPSKWHRWANVFMLSTLGVLFLLYPTIIMNGVAALRCKEIDLGQGSMQSVLVADPVVDCNSPSYRAQLPFVWLLVLAFGLGVPALFVLLVQLARRVTCDGDMDIARRMFHFATGGYDPRHWFYEGLVLLLKAVLVIAGALIPRGLVRLVTFAWILVVYIIVMRVWTPWETIWLAQLQTLSLGTIAVTCAFLSFFTFDEVINSVHLSGFVVIGVVVANGVFLAVSGYVMWWNALRSNRQSGVEPQHDEAVSVSYSRSLEKKCQRLFDHLSVHSVRLTYLIDRIIFDLHSYLRSQCNVRRLAATQRDGGASSPSRHRSDADPVKNPLPSEKPPLSTAPVSHHRELHDLLTRTQPQPMEEDEEEIPTTTWCPKRRVSRRSMVHTRSSRYNSNKNDKSSVFLTEEEYVLGLLEPLADMLLDPVPQRSRSRISKQRDSTAWTTSDTVRNQPRRELQYKVSTFVTFGEDEDESTQPSGQVTRRSVLSRRVNSQSMMSTVSCKTKDFADMIVEDLLDDDMGTLGTSVNGVVSSTAALSTTVMEPQSTTQATAVVKETETACNDPPQPAPSSSPNQQNSAIKKGACVPWRNNDDIHVQDLLCDGDDVIVETLTQEEEVKASEVAVVHEENRHDDPPEISNDAVKKSSDPDGSSGEQSSAPPIQSTNGNKSSFNVWNDDFDEIWSETQHAKRIRDGDGDNVKSKMCPSSHPPAMPLPPVPTNENHPLVVEEEDQPSLVLEASQLIMSSVYCGDWDDIEPQQNVNESDTAVVQSHVTLAALQRSNNELTGTHDNGDAAGSQFLHHLFSTNSDDDESWSPTTVTIATDQRGYGRQEQQGPERTLEGSKKMCAKKATRRSRRMQCLADLITAVGSLLYQQVLAASFVDTHMMLFSRSVTEELVSIMDHLQNAEANVISTYRAALEQVLFFAWETEVDGRRCLVLPMKDLRVLCSLLDNLIGDRNHCVKSR